MNKITDKYGNEIGSVEKRNQDYVIKDRYGTKTGTAEKDFLSNDYSLYNNYGEKTGRVEKDFWGSGATIRDKSGEKIGSVTPSGEMGGGIGIVLLVIGAIIYFSFDSLPEQFSNAWDTDSIEFFTITVTNSIFFAYNLLCIIRQKGALLTTQDSFFLTLFVELFVGAIIYVGVWVLIGVITVADGSSGVLEAVFMIALGSLMYVASSFIVMFAIAFISSLIITNLI